MTLRSNSRNISSVSGAKRKVGVRDTTSAHPSSGCRTIIASPRSPRTSTRPAAPARFTPFGENRTISSPAAIANSRSSSHRCTAQSPSSDVSGRSSNCSSPALDSLSRSCHRASRRRRSSYPALPPSRCPPGRPSLSSRGKTRLTGSWPSQVAPSAASPRQLRSPVHGYRPTRTENGNIRSSAVHRLASLGPSPGGMAHRAAGGKISLRGHANGHRHHYGVGHGRDARHRPRPQGIRRRAGTPLRPRST